MANNKSPEVMTGEHAKKLRIYYSRLVELKNLLGFNPSRFSKLTVNECLTPRLSLFVRFLTDNPECNPSEPVFAKTYHSLAAIKPTLTPANLAVMLGLDASAGDRLMQYNNMRPCTANFLRVIDHELIRCRTKEDEHSLMRRLDDNFDSEMQARGITAPREQLYNKGGWQRLSRTPGTERKSKKSSD